MQGIAIFLHAVRMVLSNLVTAIRISAVLMLAPLVLAVALGTGFVLTGEDMSHHMMRGDYPFVGVLLTQAATILVSLWVAVAWHRFILREEVPSGALPPFNGRAIGAYLVAGLIFALVLAAVAIPLALLGVVVLGPMMMAGADGPAALAVGFAGLAAVYLPTAYVAYRISPILPSAALRARMPLKEAWYATGTSGAAFVVLTIVSVAAGWLLFLPLGILSGAARLVWGFLANWVTLLVGASVLTTIYGHYVERRPLHV